MDMRPGLALDLGFGGAGAGVAAGGDGATCGPGVICCAAAGPGMAAAAADTSAVTPSRLIEGTVPGNSSRRQGVRYARPGAQRSAGTGRGALPTSRGTTAQAMSMSGPPTTDTSQPSST